MVNKMVKYETKIIGGHDVFHIGICDDEKGTCAQLEEWCYDYGEKNGFDIEIDVWYTGERLCDDILNKKIHLDMLFLDIELVSTDGIKVGRFIRDELENLETAIVYISSKSSYAMNLFRVQPIDFLIKPIKKEKLMEAIICGIKLQERKNQVFEYCVRGYHYKVPYKDIVYFYSKDKKINIVLKNEERQFNGKLKNIAKAVPHNFILVHQSYLINLDFVSECSYESVKMNNGTLINISLPYRKTVREKVTQNAWGR